MFSTVIRRINSHRAGFRARYFSKYTQILPGLGDSILSGIVSEWTVKVGDVVSEGDLVAVIDTDKVSVDIHASKGGKILKIYAEDEGEEIKVNEPLVDIDIDVEVKNKTNETSTLTPTPKEVKEESTSSQETHSTMGVRKPSIKFTHGKANETVSSPQIQEKSKQTAIETISVVEGLFPVSYGRLPPMNEKLIEKVILGGAEPYVLKKKKK